jgi:putative tricarboxylic transport membrane protein
VKTLDRYSSLFWFFLSVAVCIQARSLGLGHFRNPGPGFLFFWSGIVLAVLSVIIFLQTIRRTGGTPGGGSEKPFGNVNWMKVLCVVMALVIYGLILEWLGFVISTVLFLAFLLQSIEAKRWVVVVLVSVGSSLLTYALFELWLHARLPKGIFGF